MRRTRSPDIIAKTPLHSMLRFLRLVLNLVSVIPSGINGRIATLAIPDRIRKYPVLDLSNGERRRYKKKTNIE